MISQDGNDGMGCAVEGARLRRLPRVVDQGGLYSLAGGYGDGGGSDAGAHAGEEVAGWGELLRL